MTEIIAVKFENGNQHEHIIKYKWNNTTNNKIEISDKSEMLKFVTNNPRTVYVKDKQGTVEIFVVNAQPKYLRTKADNRWTDNLLALPTF